MTLKRSVKTTGNAIYEKSYAPCKLCDIRGLVSMIQLRTYEAKGPIDTYFFYDIEGDNGEIKMREDLNSNQRMYRTSLACRCERGRAFNELRDQKIKMLDLDLYMKGSL